MNSSPNVTHWLWPYASFSPLLPPRAPPPRARAGVVSTRVTTVGCGNALTHITPLTKDLGQAPSDPGQARPFLHKTLIDLIDSCTVHTPSPNKQAAKDLSPLRQRRGARPPLAEAALACECNAALPNLLISLPGLGEGLSPPPPRSSTNSQVNQSRLEFTGAFVTVENVDQCRCR